MLKFIADCGLACSPLVFAGIILAAMWGFKKARNQFKPRFLLLFSVPLIGLELVFSSGKPAGMDFTSSAFLGIVILSVALWQEAARASTSRAAFALLALCAGLGLAVHGTLISFGETEAVPNGIALHGWKSVGDAVGGLRQRLEKSAGKPVFLIGNDCRVASILSFYLPEKRVEGPGHPPVYIPESQMIENQFSFWPRYDEVVAVPKDTLHPDAYYTEESGVNPFMGRTALFISDEDSGEPPTSISNSFERIETVAAWSLDRQGRDPRQIRVFACYNYRSLPL